MLVMVSKVRCMIRETKILNILYQTRVLEPCWSIKVPWRLSSRRFPKGTSAHAYRFAKRQFPTLAVSAEQVRSRPTGVRCLYAHLEQEMLVS